MFQKILVASAFDALSSYAADQALELCAAMGASCRVLHVIEQLKGDTSDREVDAFYQTLQRASMPRIEALVGRFRDRGIDCASIVRIGLRWETIVEVADEEDVDLIVMGSRPTVSDGRPYLGTTSHRVFFASNRPMLIVRG